MENTAKSFRIIGGSGRAAIAVGDGDFLGIRHAADSLAEDICMVTGKEAGVYPVTEDAILDADGKLEEFVAGDEGEDADTIIIAGTIAHPWIAELEQEGRLDLSGIEGKWECYHMEVIDQPGYGFGKALVVAGSDKRGAIYGVYKVSELLGVSPWVWWADSVPKKQEKPELRIEAMDSKEPSVRYRGFFINDENPCFLNWCTNQYGGVNQGAYVRVFELLLRLKGNYLWPAMWGKSFNIDDPECPALADEYGVVMGTSHHEPMMRAQQEWTVLGDTYGGHANWNYAKNKDGLYRFWEDRIRENKDYEKIITVGMRGDGDEPMIENATTEQCIELLEQIVADQRKIIAEHINPDPSEVPQVWCLYKEVEAFYYAGMKVPEDITLMLCDDNFGNVRRLPTKEMRSHKGGFGMYYHFDYVGGPFSYKWINNMPLAKTWEQMSMAYEYGVRQIWIVNVGDLKPMELPLTYFLDLAYDFDTWGKENRVQEYLAKFVEREFGDFFCAKAAEGNGISPEKRDDTGVIGEKAVSAMNKEGWLALIAEALDGYTWLNGIRKPESLRQDTFSLMNFSEADRMLAAYETVLAKAELAAKYLAPEKADCYYQLVLHPVKASCIMYRLLINTAKNHCYAELGSSLWKKAKLAAEEAFRADAAETEKYNHEIADGKWNGMMDQAHIGQTNWQSAEVNEMPECKEDTTEKDGGLLVVPEGGTVLRNGVAELEALNNVSCAARRIALFNTGECAYECEVLFDEGLLVEKLALTPEHLVRSMEGGEPLTSGTKITVEEAALLLVRGDLELLDGTKKKLVLTAGERRVELVLPVTKLDEAVRAEYLSAQAGDIKGYLALRADAYEQSVAMAGAEYRKIEGYGREYGAMKAYRIAENSATENTDIQMAAGKKAEQWISLRESRTPGIDAPYLEYSFYMIEPSEVTITAYTAPTNQLSAMTGMQYGVQVDDGEIRIADTFPIGTPVGEGWVWEQGVLDNVHKARTQHGMLQAGRHTLRFYMKDDGLVLQKLLVETTGKAPVCNLGVPAEK
ncbi:MAG: glycosyl hydrolase 115 family protein [Lachnospiraceae bacterium]|nr:glycosyl hydrolase 115 family protein [Lachnospiraceae bacterium]